MTCGANERHRCRCTQVAPTKAFETAIVSQSYSMTHIGVPSPLERVWVSEPPRTDHAAVYGASRWHHAVVTAACMYVVKRWSFDISSVERSFYITYVPLSSSEPLGVAENHALCQK